MAVRYLNTKFFHGGISDSSKIGIKGSFYFGQRLNIFDEPTAITIMPKAAKVSGSNVTDLIKWLVPGNPYDTNMYGYSEGGKIYKGTSADSWSSLQTTANAGGQGLEVYNDYLYYTQDTQVGRYGLLSGSPTFTDNWQTGLTSTADTDIAPIKAFLNGLAIGHGNKLAWWDGSTFTAAKLTFAAGYNVRCLEVIDEFLVIGCWRGTTITANEQGRIYFWDGTSQSYNYMVEINEGGVAAVLNNKNRLITSIGGSGSLMLNYRPFQKFQNIPLLTVGKYAEISPGAVCNWRGMAQIGLAWNTDSASIIQGVYTYGSSNEFYPEAMNYSFSISTGTTTGTTLQIGAIKGVGNNLYIAWRDGSSYGVDKVSNSAAPYATAVFESLIFDNEQLYHDKLAKKLKAAHLPLVSGESVQLGYKINRASSYTLGTANSTVDSTETELPIPSGRFREFQFEIILATSGSTSPTVTYAGLEFDDLSLETEF